MKFPSVTRVISPWQDFSMIREDVLEAACARGSKVHQICGALALGLWIPVIPAELQGYVDSFMGWFSDAVQRVHLAERELVDAQSGYRGHPDLIVTMRGDAAMTLIDLKTPATCQLAWRVQLAAYRNLATINGYPVARVFSLRLRKGGESPLINEYSSTFSHDFAVFLNCLAAWKFFKGGK